MDYSKEPIFSYSINHRRVPTAKIMQELRDAHGNKCAYCGIDITAGNIVIDSFFPYHSNPDVSSSENYVLSCARCNNIKGGKSPLSTDGQVLIIHPYSDSYHTEIIINNDGIAEGKTAAGMSTINLLQLNRPELVSFRKDHISEFIERINDGSSAHDVYKCSINQIRELLRTKITDLELQEYFHRMIYANVIASMEAYLSKTFISAVLNNEVFFWEFVRQFDWDKEKVNINNIKEKYDKMPMKVQTKLTEILYHNIPKVKALYKKVLNVNILQNQDDMRFLCSSIDIRHDLVHRNGRKGKVKSEDEYHNISLTMIEELITHVDNLIQEIESQFHVE